MELRASMELGDGRGSQLEEEDTPFIVEEQIQPLSTNSARDVWYNGTKQAVQPHGPAVRTPILSHTDLACNTSYHFAASRTVFPRVPPYLARDAGTVKLWPQV